MYEAECMYSRSINQSIAKHDLRISGRRLIDKIAGLDSVTDRRLVAPTSNMDKNNHKLRARVPFITKMTTTPDKHTLRWRFAIGVVRDVRFCDGF
jgi:hypothetical protein